MVQVVGAEITVGEHVGHQRDSRHSPAAAVGAGVRGPVEQVGVLPFGAEVVDPEAVVVVPRDEREVRGAHEAAFVAGAPGVVEVVVRRGGEVVVPAPDQQVDACPAQERARVEDGLHRGAERVGGEAAVPSGQADPVDPSHELREVVVAVRGRVVLVGLEPVGRVGGVRRAPVLASAVVAVGSDPVLERRAAEVAAVGLVQVALVVLAEAALQEALVDLLDQRVQAHVPLVDGELGVGVPGGWDTDRAEQPPGQSLPLLGRVVEHRLEVEGGHARQSLTVEVRLPGPLRRAQCPVAAVDQREPVGLEEHPGRPRGCDLAAVGRVGHPHRQPCVRRGVDRLFRRQPIFRPPGHADHVHGLPEQLGGGVIAPQPRSRSRARSPTKIAQYRRPAPLRQRTHLVRLRVARSAMSRGPGLEDTVRALRDTRS